MSDATKLGPWVRRFLLEYLVGERNLARNTQRSYRDALALMITFIAARVRKQIDQLTVEDITAGQCDSSCKTWSRRGAAVWPRVING